MIEIFSPFKKKLFMHSIFSPVYIYILCFHIYFQFSLITLILLLCDKYSKATQATVSIAETYLLSIAKRTSAISTSQSINPLFQTIDHQLTILWLKCSARRLKTGLHANRKKKKMWNTFQSIQNWQLARRRNDTIEGFYERLLAPNEFLSNWWSNRCRYKRARTLFLAKLGVLEGKLFRNQRPLNLNRIT